MAVLDPVQRRADAEAALLRQDIISRLSGLAQALPAAEERIAKAETQVIRVGRDLAGEMEAESSLGRTLPALRQQYAASQSELVEVRSEMDRVRREDCDCRRRMDQIAVEIDSWRACYARHC